MVQCTLTSLIYFRVVWAVFALPVIYGSLAIVRRIIQLGLSGGTAIRWCFLEW